MEARLFAKIVSMVLIKVDVSHIGTHIVLSQDAVNGIIWHFERKEIPLEALPLSHTSEVLEIPITNFYFFVGHDVYTYNELRQEDDLQIPLPIPVLADVWSKEDAVVIVLKKNPETKLRLL